MSIQTKIKYCTEQSNEPAHILLGCFIDVVTKSLWRFVTNKYWFLSFMEVIILVVLLCKLRALLYYTNGYLFYRGSKKTLFVRITR